MSNVRVFVDPRAASCVMGGHLCAPLLIEKGVKFVGSSDDAEIIVVDQTHQLRKYLLQFNIRVNYLLWTQEPRFHKTFNSIERFCRIGKRVHVMNVYTGDIFMNNYTIWGHKIQPKLIIEGLSATFEGKLPRVIALMTYMNNASRLEYKGADIDLIQLRQRVALNGYRLGICDIHGKNWPSGIVSVPPTRMRADWSEAKDQEIKPYRFNLCMENTAFPYYCTEKIWDSIRNYCLPIYHGGRTAIYDDFSRQSFIDYSEFKSDPELFDFIRDMTVAEWEERMVSCIATFNKCHHLRHEVEPSPYLQVLDRFAEKAHQIVGR